MKLRILIACALTALLSNANATVHNISVGSNFFNPSTLTIVAGDVVIWTNTGGHHNVNGTTATFPGNPASFGNSVGPAGWTYQFQFNIPGTYSYQCDPHAPGMSGTITVNPAPPVTSDLILTGVVDGPLSGGLPKALELYAAAPIADLSAYGVARSNNGAGSNGGPAFVLPADAAVQGQHIYITNDSLGFYTFFGFSADYVDTATNFRGVAGNGDDAYELYKNNTVVDVMGDVNVDGTGTPWEYLDSWAYRVDNTGPDGSTFVLANWTFGGPNVLDNQTTNATAPTPFPIGTYNMGGTIGAGGIPTYSIATVTTSDANGVPDSLNAEVRLHGIVYTDDFDGNAGYSFFMYDNTGGINVFNFNDVGTFVVNRGDSIRVIGSIDQFNGLTEIVIDSVVVLSTGHTLKMPAVVTTLDESTEGEYIRMNNMTLVTPSQWPASGASANVDITDGTNTFILRIDNDTDIDGSPAPTGAFDVIGAGGQFDSSNPFTSGYQIQPRDLTDIIPVVATTPTVGFAASTRSVLENAGSVTVNLPIAPSSTTAETVKIYVSNGAGVTAADYTTTPAAVADTITLTAAANATAVSFSVNVIDDAILEANENITFTVARVSSGLSISTTLNAQVFTIQDNDTPIPTYDIAQIDGTDALGVMDSAGVYCKIIATVTSPQLSATRTDFFITNATNTAGIKVNQATLIAYNAVVGDQIRVVGELSQFRGGIQISADSLTVLSSGNPIQPTVQPASAGMAEPEEGRVLRYNGVELVDSTGWPSANFGNFDIVLANGDTVILRLDSDIPTLWGPAPVGKFDVIGVAGQYASSSSAPFLDGYQIQPRISTEIIVVLPKLAITEVMPSSNLSGAIGGDWFELTNYGSTPITLNGFSWDDNSRTAGTHTIASLTSLIINAGQSIIFYDGVHPEDSAWAYEWSQAANNIVVIGADDFGPIGFSGLGSGGDEVNFYDDKGQLISRATYVGGDISPGVSVEFDTAGVKLGQSTVGVRGAYASLGGDIGSPGNMMPISLSELLLTNMSIYPNPATDRVQISTANNAPKAFTLLDMTGNRIMQVESTQETVSLNVANLPAGVYLLQVNVDGQRATRKLIVQ